MKNFVLGSLLALLIAPCTSFAEDGTQEVILEDSAPISSDTVSPGSDEISGYLRDLTREDSALGTVMQDVVRIKRERCDLNMGVQDIKLIANKDEVFKQMQEKVDNEPSYVDSFEYKGTMKRHFGNCG